MFDTIIVGAGIAGLTAALYASRKGMNYKIISSDFGGQFLVSGEVLNYPGIIKTTGVEFSSIMQEQMKFNNVEILLETIESVEKTDHFIIKTNKNTYETKTLIIATGARSRLLNVKGEKELSNKGVSYCSICDGPLFTKKKVIIAGGGSSALEAIDFVKDFASELHLFVIGPSLTGHEYLQERIKKSHVEIHYNAEITEIKGDKFVSGVSYKQDGEEKSMDIDGVIVEIGRVPNTEMFKSLVDIDEHGHIKIDAQSVTSQEGVFAAGDCADGHEYQFTIAAGQGCMALIKAARYLQRLS